MSWEALDLALALHAHPQRIEEARSRSLPSGITEVLRVALEHEATLASAMATTGQPSAQLIEASRFFIEQQMLARECQHDPWRILGVATGAEVGQIREHHRLLMRLVHPDRGDDWALAYADRVNKAWRQLRHEDGRLEAGATASIPADDVSTTRAPAPTETNANDAWAIRNVRTAPLRVLEPPTPPPPPTVPRAGMPVGAIAIGAVATLSIAIAAGYWFGVQRGQQFTQQEVSGDAVVAAVDEHEEALVAEPPMSATSMEAALPAALDAATRIASEPNPPPDVGAPALPEPLPSNAAALAEVPRTSRPEPATTPVHRAPKPEAAPVTRRVQAGRPARVAASNVSTSERIARQDIPDGSDPIRDAPIANVPPPPAIREPPAPPPVAVAAATAPAEVEPSRADAIALLDTYQRNYADGDLGGVLGLFAREVHAEDQRVAAIAKYYAKLFDTTSDRVIALHDLRWQRDGERMRGSGQYQARFRPKNKVRYETIVGVIEFEFVSDDGRSRLLRLDTKPGKRS